MVTNSPGPLAQQRDRDGPEAGLAGALMPSPCSPHPSQPDTFLLENRGSREGVREARWHAGPLPRRHGTLLATRGKGPGVFLPGAGNHKAQGQGSHTGFQSLLEPYQVWGSFSSSALPTAQPPKPHAPLSTQLTGATLEPLSSSPMSKASLFLLCPSHLLFSSLFLWASVWMSAPLRTLY